MSTLVHLSDEKNSNKIMKSGIALGRLNKSIYFMPVLQYHFISHQWLRELRRRGARVLVGVYFRIPSTETVWAGKYNEPHKEITLGEAIGEISSLADPLGTSFSLQERFNLPRLSRYGTCHKK